MKDSTPFLLGTVSYCTCMMYMTMCIYTCRRKPSGEGFTQQDVAVGGTQEIMVTYVKDPSHFQVRLYYIRDLINSLLIATRVI